MKNLEDFLAEQIDVKSIAGGIGGPVANTGPRFGTVREKASSIDPNCCEQRTDMFYDHNGNGLWDSFPSYGAEEGGDTSNWVVIC